MPRKDKEKLRLECVLTDPEKLAYSKTLAEHISGKRGEEDALRSYATQAKAEIASHDAQINLLSEKLRTGKEYREVECEVARDWKARTKRWIRTDTGEIAREDIIPSDEIQEEMMLKKVEE